MESGLLVAAPEPASAITLLYKRIPGSIAYRECEYFQRNPQEKECRAAKTADEQRADIEAMKRNEGELSEIGVRVRTALQEEQAGTRRKEMELARLRAQWEHVDITTTAYVAAQDVEAGRTPNAELQRETVRLDGMRQEEEKKQSQLEVVQGVYVDRIAHVSRTYDAVLKHVLSPAYSGVFRMDKGLPSFTISETTGLAGEAVETLALVLADVSAVLCLATGQGFHPRFLIHDSPREADLDRHVYNRFLRAIAQLSDSLGGADSAPFQHIVTTTTRPPEVLLDSDIVKLRLAAPPETEMLFGCRLQEVDVQSELVVDDA